MSSPRMTRILGFLACASTIPVLIMRVIVAASKARQVCRICINSLTACCGSCRQSGAGRDCHVTLLCFAASVDVRFFASRAVTSSSLPEPHFEMHCMTLIAGRFNRCTRLVAMT